MGCLHGCGIINKRPKISTSRHYIAIKTVAMDEIERSEWVRLWGLGLGHTKLGDGIKSEGRWHGE